MWGSWVGAGLGFLGAITSQLSFNSLASLIVGTVSGFLIGWGIHSLFRKFWKA